MKMQVSVVILSAVCLGYALQCEGAGSNVNSLDASPECAGEVRVSFEHSADGQAQHVVKRDTHHHVIGVSYKPSDSSPDDAEMHKEFSGSTSQSLSLLIRGLAPGKKYQLRVRHGDRSQDGTAWGEYSEVAEAVSGMVNAQAGPDGVGESSRNFCQSRRRSGRVASPKGSRLHHATFASTSRRRRYYVPSSYYYTTYDYYSNYYYNYYYYGGTSLGGAIAGGVIGFIFIISAIVICCKFYFYGGCGRNAYRNRAVHTTFVSTAHAQPNMTAGQPQVAMTTLPSAYGGGNPCAPSTMEAKPAYPSAPQATAYPSDGAQNQATFAPAAYPPAPQAQQAPAWGGMAAAPYPSSSAAPPPYSQANQM